MKRVGWILMVCLLATGLLSACTGGTVVSGEDMSGSDVSVTKGQELSVQLYGNASTGYSWVVQELDTSVLQQSGDPDYKADSNLVGSGGTYTYKFKALETGKTTLKMAYLQIGRAHV